MLSLEPRERHWSRTEAQMTARSSVCLSSLAMKATTDSREKTSLS